jgi:hypothetical protein
VIGWQRRRRSSGGLVLAGVTIVVTLALASDPAHRTSLLPDLSPDARSAGSARFERLFEESGGAEAFAEDPHTFECVRCHGAEDPVDAAAWRFRCQSSECHPRAWPLTVYHRVPPESFTVCTNCHVPHRFTAHGEDCLSCHADLLDSAEEVVVPAALGGGSFAHARHAELDCARCHVTYDRHAELTLTGSGECLDCHHSGDAGEGCASCHEGGPAIASRPVTLTVRAVGAAHPRQVGFEHARHETFDCERCHTSPREVREVVACASCHQDHHRPEARCLTCHATPREDAHDLYTHLQSCQESGCHGDTGYTATARPRSVCLVCHTDLKEHRPGEDCAGCHLIPDRGSIPVIPPLEGTE